MNKRFFNDVCSFFQDSLPVSKKGLRELPEGHHVDDGHDHTENYPIDGNDAIGNDYFSRDDVENYFMNFAMDR